MSVICNNCPPTKYRRLFSFITILQKPHFADQPAALLKHVKGPRYIATASQLQILPYTMREIKGSLHLKLSLKTTGPTP